MGLMAALDRVFEAIQQFFGRSYRRRQHRLAWLGQKGKGHERHQAGWRAEDYAAAELIRRGYHIFARNVALDIGEDTGEIDIVAEHDRRLVFIEVRSRSHDAPIRPASTVTVEKQRRVIRLGQAWMRERHLTESEVRPRYDIAEVWLDEERKPFKFEVLEGVIHWHRRRR